MVSTQEEAKHAHLLQPIRDLAANWEINIASELEDYLEVLESVTFTIEGSSEVNFAEAALLVQGSVHVYSKKVEYLHQMVHQALDVIGEKKKKQVRDAEGQSCTPSEEADFDEEEMFLRLDDVLQAGQDIDLDDSGTPLVHRPLQVPSVLMALDNPVHGYCAGANGVSFGIASCVVHESGALLLEEGDGEMLDCMLRRRTAMRTSPSGAFHAPPQQAVAVELANEDDCCQAPSPVACDNDREMPDTYDDDGVCGDVQSQHWDDCGPEDEARQAADQQQSQPAAEAAADEEEFDPWAPLDMYDPGNMASKPFWRAKRLPKFRPAADRAAGCSGRGSIGARAAGLAGPSPTPPAPSRLTFVEFAPALHALQAAARAKARCQPSARPARHSAFTAMPRDEEAVNGVSGDNGSDHERWDDDPGGAAAGQSDDDDDYMALPDPLTSGFPCDADMARDGSNGGSPHAPSYEQLCRAHVDAFISAAAAADRQSDLAARVSEWKTRIQPVVDDQDARESFDMEVYGERILARLKALNVNGTQPISAPLASAIQDCHKWQVARLFAASLQLINNGNFDIDRSDAAELTVQIKCLSFAEKRTGYPVNTVTSSFSKGAMHTANGSENEQLRSRQRVVL